MAENFSHETITTALNTLATEGVPSSLTEELTSALRHATSKTERGTASLCIDGSPLVSLSRHGSFTLFAPPQMSQNVSRRLATFDRCGRLILLMTWNPNGKLARFKVRGLDGRFLGIECGTASHLGWGLSDSVYILAGEEGFAIDSSLTLFGSVAYEDVNLLPPLDAPARLPAGAGSTILNVFALLARDQGKTLLRYRGPYPTERLFATLNESFRYRGEPGVTRERFTREAEEAAVNLTMLEVPVDWEPYPHERFFPAAHTCVQLRDGVEKVYDRGRIYYRPDLFANAYVLRAEQPEDGGLRYVASLAILGQSLEDHLILDAEGEILERPLVPPSRALRGTTQLADEWKAVLVRLIASESTAPLRPALWPVINELTLEWSPVRGELWMQTGNELRLHAGMVAAYREVLADVRSAGERLLLAARFTSELARLIGPVVRMRAQEQMTKLSPEEQQMSFLFSSSSPTGLPDNELRAFLMRLAMGEELPKLE